MPHMQPQPCINGCCEEVLECCLRSKQHFMSTYGWTTLRISAGPTGGPYIPQDEKCGSSSSFLDFPAYDLSGSYDVYLDENLCSDYILEEVCPGVESEYPFGYIINPTYVNCTWPTYSHGLYLDRVAFPDDFTCPVGYYPIHYPYAPISMFGSVNWFCDEMGNYKFLLTIALSVVTYEQAGAPSLPTPVGYNWYSYLADTITNRYEWYKNGTSPSTDDASLFQKYFYEYGPSSSTAFILRSSSWITNDDNTPSSVTLWLPSEALDWTGITAVEAVAELL